LKKLSGLIQLNLSSNNIKALTFLSPHSDPASSQLIPQGLLSTNYWPRLEHLNLSYNRLPVSSLAYFRHLPRLKDLNLSGNGLTHLPDDLSHILPALESLDLSHNQLSSHSSVFHPSKYFLAFSTLPRLKILNLSHN